MKTNIDLTDDIIRLLKNKLEKEYVKGHTKRDAHAKSLGLLKGKFVVDDLEDKYKIGIFKEARSFDALIRTSNAMTHNDCKKGVRGFSIKLLDVYGDRVISNEKFTQDFLLVSSETMPIGTLKLFHDMIYYTSEGNPLFLFFRLFRENQLHIIKDVKKYLKHHTSPLDIEYFSTTPYMFGDEVVKYKIVPRSKYRSVLPDKLYSTYLSDNMQTHLNYNKALFDFYVQFKTSEDMPINDASVLWDETKSPFIKLGTLIIPSQKFMTDERNELSENLSYSPGHSLTVHRPIGDINEARTKIYDVMSEFRHSQNDKAMVEPDSTTFDNLI